MIYLYNVLLAMATVLVLPYGIYRLVAGKDSVSSYLEKLSLYRFATPPKGGIWIHAVSVGETNAAVPLVDALLKCDPRPTIVFTTSTATGMALARKKLEGKATVAFFPFDFPFSVQRALSLFSPSAVVFMETEIWPNFLHAAHRRAIPAVLVNGRISDHSFGKYRPLKGALAPFLSMYARLLMQSDDDAEKIVALGAKWEAIAITGNLKFDKPLPEATDRKEICRHFGIPGDRPVILFASTHPGEDELFLETAQKLQVEHVDLFPVIAPRHVQRAGTIVALAAQYGFRAVRRSDGEEKAESMLILDTIGELAYLCGAATVTVTGGSFVPHGGQNPLEAAQWKVPTAFGPHMENFREIARKLTESGGAKRAGDRNELVSIASRWLASPDEARKAGGAGYETVVENMGALKKTVDEIMTLVGKQ